MILKSFDAFKKVYYSEHSSEDFTGIVTRERIDQIVAAIQNGEYVSEIFCVNDFDAEGGNDNWFGLKVEWSDIDRSGILTIKYQAGMDWYKFNLGSLHLNHLYELVPDMDESDEEKLRAVAEEEVLDSLMNMKWKS